MKWVLSSLLLASFACNAWYWEKEYAKKKRLKAQDVKDKLLVELAKTQINKLVTHWAQNHSVNDSSAINTLTRGINNSEFIYDTSNQAYKAFLLCESHLKNKDLHKYIQWKYDEFRKINTPYDTVIGYFQFSELMWSLDNPLYKGCDWGPRIIFSTSKPVISWDETFEADVIVGYYVGDENLEVRVNDRRIPTENGMAQIRMNNHKLGYNYLTIKARTGTLASDTFWKETQVRYFVK